MAGSVRTRAGSKKARQKLNNLRKQKYMKAFIRCVKRTGKWRGKPATTAEAFSH